MSKTSVNIKRLDDKHKSPWIALAEDAERRSEDLAKAAKIFRNNEHKGEPWPLTQPDHQTTKSCHRV